MLWCIDGGFRDQWSVAEASSSRVSTRHVAVLSTTVCEDSCQQRLRGLSTAADGDCSAAALSGCCCCQMASVSGVVNVYKKGKGSHTLLPSVGFRSWSRFLAVSLLVTWVINLAVGFHYFPPGLQLPSQPLRGLLPVSLLGEQRHDGCEQFAYDYYPTASRLRFEPRVWVQHAKHLATEPPKCIV